MLFVVATTLAASPPPAVALDALTLEFRQDGEAATAEHLAALYAEACAAPWTPACAPESWRVEGRPDLAAARGVFGPLCVAGDPLACIVEGWTLTQLPSTPGNASARAPGLAVGAARFRAACDAGYPRGCSELASVTVEAEGVDLVVQWDLARTACDAGVGNACKVAANIVWSTTLVPDPWGTSRALASRGCSLGDRVSCTVLAGDRYAGRGVSADPAGALAELRQLCDDGVPYACRLVANALDDADDAAGARDALARGCEWRDDESCAQLALADAKATHADPSRGIAALEALCAAGSGPACRLLGYQLRDGSLVAIDPPRAHAAFEAGCSLGDEDACATSGFRLLHGIGTQQDTAKGLALLRTSCRSGDPEACELAGRTLADGRIVTRDTVAARTLLERGCGLEQTGACLRLGQLLEQERDRVGASRVYAQGRAQLEERCDRGAGASCAALAQLHEEGLGVRRSVTRAGRILADACVAHPRTCTYRASFFGDHPKRPFAEERAAVAATRGCAAGSDRACYQVAVQQITGAGTPPDVDAGRVALEERCRAGEFEACSFLGAAYSAGRLGNVRDVHAAIPWWERACAHGEWTSCRALATALADGNGTPADPARAVAIWGASCDEGDNQACLDLAKRQRKGMGVRQEDAALALARYAQVCGRGWARGCKLEAEMRAAGLGVPADPAGAAVLRRRACDLGDRAACKED